MILYQIRRYELRNPSYIPQPSSKLTHFPARFILTLSVQGFLLYNEIMNTCPLEDDEEAALTDYCELMHYTHWHVPNETYTTSWKQKMKNKRLGVNSGVSDHWVRVSVEGYPAVEWLFIFEMKRKKGNLPTDKQIAFIRNMNKMENVHACCTYGADEAIRVLEDAKKFEFGFYRTLIDRMDKLAENREKKAKNRKIKEKNDSPF